MRIADLLTDSKTLDFKGATITYNPQALSTADMEALATVDRNAPQEVFDNVIGAISRVIMAWDLEDEQGPIPVTPEGIRRTPWVIVDNIMGAIMDDSQPTEAEKKDSSELSVTPHLDSSKPQPESQNGTTSSPQHDTSALHPGTSPVSHTAG